MPGPSGYTTAFTHPDPLDPNDAKRQKTQARSDDYPYDMKISYGSSLSTAMGGDAYQDNFQNSPPVPRKSKAYTRPTSVWDRISDAINNDLNPVEIGQQGKNANFFGYGKNGLRDEFDQIDVEFDDLKNDFSSLGNSCDCEYKNSLVDLLGSMGIEAYSSDDPVEIELEIGDEEDENFY